MDYHHYYIRMADGTIKQVNPFTGVEVWTVPERGRRALRDAATPLPDEPLVPHDPEDHCSFCCTRLFETAPEKARVVRRNGDYLVQHQINPSDIEREAPLFRRVSNLFEIVSIDYWRQNYNYKLSTRNQTWKQRYLADPRGLQHVSDIIDYKLRRAGRPDEDIAGISPEDKLLLADAFFGGGHELIIGPAHFRPGARTSGDLFATADLNEEEHFRYFLFIIDAMMDIVENNRYVRYISVYKNWLRPAGATLDHLHTQLVAIDEWGAAIDRQIKMIVGDKNVFNTYGPNFAALHNFIFAENEYALAFVGIGHRYPTVEIYSKSVNARPHEHTAEETRGMSDLARACHAAIGSRVSVNEEWYYSPFDSIFKMPWHINIKLRINVPAGFEGGTSIFINPLSLTDLRDRLVPELFRLRNEGRIGSGIRIAEECRIVRNALQYYRNT
jgi:galactose-1-phosphate uridylyltransferase